MKSAVCFLYALASIIYLIYGDSSIIWGGINIITQTSFIGFLCYWMQDSPSVNSDERLIFEYLTMLSGINTVYIIVCMFRNKFWVIYQTDIFAYILGISFVVLLVHIGYNKGKFK